MKRLMTSGGGLEITLKTFNGDILLRKMK